MWRGIIIVIITTSIVAGILIVVGVVCVPVAVGLSWPPWLENSWDVPLSSRIGVIMVPTLQMLHAASSFSWLGARLVACIVEPQTAMLSSKWGPAYSCMMATCITMVGGAHSVVIVLHLNVLQGAPRWHTLQASCCHIERRGRKEAIEKYTIWLLIFKTNRREEGKGKEPVQANAEGTANAQRHVMDDGQDNFHEQCTILPITHGCDVIAKSSLTWVKPPLLHHHQAYVVINETGLCGDTVLSHSAAMHSEFMQDKCYSCAWAELARNGHSATEQRPFDATVMAPPPLSRQQW
ncbi:hypothetical protein EDB89DRAFT_1904647 [Lactarius sanguifluus]|nr:hypothetical protein EDB89DRAFT_1904647 [Lactarius sanguifluus]